MTDGNNISEAAESIDNYMKEFAIRARRADGFSEEEAKVKGEEDHRRFVAELKRELELNDVRQQMS